MAASMEHISKSGLDKQSKNANKRKRKLSNNSDNADKSKLLKETTYTVAEFKFQLRDVTTTFTALERFIEEAKLYPHASDNDIVANYSRSSGEFSEIFKLLEGEKRQSAEICLILEVLEHCLVRITDDLGKYSSVAQNISRRLLTNHFGRILFMMTPAKKAAEIKSALKLMTALVMSSNSTARDLCLQFDFQDPRLEKLLRHRTYQDKQDVRTCLIMFVMSFLVTGDTLCIKTLLNSDFLKYIFADMITDKSNTIEMVLTTILDKVILNERVTKTMKVKLFNQHVLKKLGALYEWKRPRHGKDADTQTEQDTKGEEESEAEERARVHALVHKFLRLLCCSYDYGVCFHDKTFATTVNKNENITMFLRSLEQPYAHELKADLLIHTLAASPDLLQWYLPTLSTAFTPRPRSPAWCSAMDFLCKVFNQQTKVSPALKLEENTILAADKLVAMVTNTLLSPKTKQGMTCILEATKHTDRVVLYKILSVSSIILSRIQHSLSFCTSHAHLNNRQFHSLLLDTLYRGLLKAPFLVRLWKDTISSIAKNGEKMEVEAESGLPIISDMSMLKMILQLLCQYQRVFAAQVSAVAVDYLALLDGAQQCAANMADEQQVRELYMCVLQVLAESGEKSVNWTKKNADNKTFLQFLLEMVAMPTDDLKMKALCRNLVTKMFLSTGVFEENREEVNVWLKVLSEISAEKSVPVVKFLEESLLTLFRKPYSYTEQVAELCAEASGMDGLVQDDATSVATTSNLIIDSILSLEENICLEEENENGSKRAFQQDKVAAQVQRFPFSGLLPCMCAMASTNTAVTSQEVRHYVYDVTRVLIRKQRDPLPLCLLVAKHQKIFDARLMLKLSRFLPKKLRKELKTPEKKKKRKSLLGLIPDSKLSQLLEEYFEAEYDFTDNTAITEQALGAVSDVKIEGCGDAVKHVLLYLRTEIVMSGKINHNNVEFYFTILNRLIKMALEETYSKTPDPLNSASKNQHDKDQKEDGEKAKKSGSDSDESGDDSEEERNEADHTESVEDSEGQLLALHTEEKSNEALVLECVTMILQHPTLCRAFLWQAKLEEQSNVKLKRRMGTISDLVTKNVCGLIGLLSKYSLLQNKAIGSLITDYISRLNGVVHDESSGGSLKPGPRTDVFVAISVFLPLLTGNTLVNCVHLYMRKQREDLISGDDTSLTNHGQVLSQILKQIVQNSTQCYSTSTISSNSIQQLLQLNRQSPAFEGVLVDLFTTVPAYSDMVTEKLFKEYIAEENRQALASLLLVHSARCREWFEEWVTAEETNRRKIHKLKHAAITHAYLVSTSGNASSKGFLQTMYELTYEPWVNFLKHGDLSREPQRKHTTDSLTIFLQAENVTGKALVSKEKKLQLLSDLLEINKEKVRVYQIDFLRYLWKHVVDIGGMVTSDHVSSCASVALKGLCQAHMENKQDDRDSELESSCVAFLLVIFNYVMSNDIRLPVRRTNQKQKFCFQDLLNSKTILKHGYGNEKVFELLLRCVDAFGKGMRSDSDEIIKENIPILDESTKLDENGDVSESESGSDMHQDISMKKDHTNNTTSSDSDSFSAEDDDDSSDEYADKSQSKSKVMPTDKSKKQTSKNMPLDDGSSSSDEDSTSDDGSSSDSDSMSVDGEENASNNNNRVSMRNYKTNADEDALLSTEESSSGEEDSSDTESSETGDETPAVINQTEHSTVQDCQEENEAKLAVLKTLYDMLLSHSGFMELMLGEQPQPGRGALLKLLVATVSLNGAVCEKSHVTLLFGAYSASLRTEDVCVLRLLQLYEKNGAKLADYRPYLWGAKAIDHYSVKKNLGSALWRQPSVEQVLELLDGERMRQSALHFPLTRKLQVQIEVSRYETKQREDVYDPCFLLPLFNYLLSSENVVDCRKFVELHCLSYTLSALSCHDSHMRAAAYSVLARLQHHLEGARLPEKTQLLLLLQLLRRSVEEAGAKLPCIITVFLATCAPLMLKPEGHMYMAVNQFLTVKPRLDTRNVPEFYKFFKSSQLQYATERKWMLELLGDGLREAADWDIYEGRSVLEYLLAFHDSALSDLPTQKQVLHVVHRAVSLRKVAFNLSTTKAIVPWITGVIQAGGLETKNSLIVDIVHTMWFTLLDARDLDLGVRDRVNPVLPFQPLADLSALVWTLLRKSGSFESRNDVMKLTSVLASILKHQAQRQQYLQRTSDTSSGTSSKTSGTSTTTATSARSPKGKKAGVKSKLKGQNEKEGDTILDVSLKNESISQFEKRVLSPEPSDVLKLLYHWSGMEAVSQPCSDFRIVSEVLLSIAGLNSTTKKTEQLQSELRENAGVFVISDSLGDTLKSTPDLLESVIELTRIISYTAMPSQSVCNSEKQELVAFILCLQWCLQASLLSFDTAVSRHDQNAFSDTQLELIEFLARMQTDNDSAIKMLFQSNGALSVMLQLLLGKYRTMHCKLEVHANYRKVKESIEKLL